MSPVLAFIIGVDVGFAGFCFYGELRVRRARRTMQPVLLSRDVAGIYDPLYTWVRKAEARGDITEEEASAAFLSLLEAEALERQLLEPAATDGPEER
jgi:hypothetical protein